MPGAWPSDCASSFDELPPTKTQAKPTAAAPTSAAPASVSRRRFVLSELCASAIYPSSRRFQKRSTPPAPPRWVNGCRERRWRSPSARYVGRDGDEERRPAGLHRYEVAQGFQPGRIECYGISAEDVIERASRYMGGAPERVWLSSETEGWRGPPACWAQWA